MTTPNIRKKLRFKDGKKFMVIDEKIVPLYDLRKNTEWMKDTCELTKKISSERNLEIEVENREFYKISKDLV
ncbi:MAG: hypothetical protein ACTSWW_11795 [Promethearchaeota archaeon]